MLWPFYLFRGNAMANYTPSAASGGSKDRRLGPLEDLREYLERLHVTGRVTSWSCELCIVVEDDEVQKGYSSILRPLWTVMVWLSLFGGVGLFIWNKYIGGPNPALVIFPCLTFLFGVGMFAKAVLDQDFANMLSGPLTRAESVVYRPGDRVLEILVALWAIRTAPIGSRFVLPFLPTKTYENDSRLFMEDPLVMAIKQISKDYAKRGLLQEIQLDKKTEVVARHLPRYMKMYQRQVRPAAMLVRGGFWAAFMGTLLFVTTWFI